MTQAASSRLRRADPDASFVYLGVVDETAHLVGSATPAYADAIATTDRRIGQLLRAVRSRPSYPFESWTILVTTDHGQRPLDEPSLVSHLSQTPLEITAFVAALGPGLGAKSQEAARRGRRSHASSVSSGCRSGRPGSSTAVRCRGRAEPPRRSSRCAEAAPRAASPSRSGWAARLPGVRSVVLRLPAGVEVAGSVRALVNGRPVSAAPSGPRTIVARFSARALRRLSLATAPGSVRVAAGVGGTAPLGDRDPARSQGEPRHPSRAAGGLTQTGRTFPPRRPYVPGDVTDPGGPSDAQAARPRPGPADARRGSAAGGASEPDAHASATKRVKVGDLFFKKSRITIQSGDTVKWTWVGERRTT